MTPDQVPPLTKEERMEMRRHLACYENCVEKHPVNAEHWCDRCEWLFDNSIVGLAAEAFRKITTTRREATK